MELNDQYSQNSAALKHANAIRQKDSNPVEDTVRRIAQVDKSLHFKSGMRILDIGCGRGYLSSILNCKTTVAK